MSSLEDRKGEPIKLVGGTAKKHRGMLGAWLDIAKAPTACYYHIIVEKYDPEDPDSTYLDTFKALKTNIETIDPPPTTYIQAAFMQVPQLGERLTSFCKMCAKCRVQRSPELSEIIKRCLDKEAYNQKSKGSMAEYKIIDTSGIPNTVEEDDDVEQ